MLQILLGTASISVLGKVLQVIVGIALARLLQPEGYGVYALSIAASFVVVRIINLGWPITVNRLLPQYRAEDDLALFNGVIISSMTTIVVTCGMSSMVLIGAGQLWPLSASTQAIIFSICVIAPCLAFRTLLKSLLAALGAAKRGIALEDLIPATAMIIWLGTLSVYRETITPLSAAIAFALASLLSVAVGTLWFLPLLPSGTTANGARFHLSTWLKSSVTTMWGQAARLLVNRADIIMLGAISTLEATGLYAIALRLCQLLTIPSTAVQTYIAPNISASRAKNKPDRVRFLLRLSLLFAIASSAPLAIAFSFWRESLITMTFGSSYMQAAQVIVLLAIGKVFVATSNALSSYMMMTDREGLFSVLSTASMIINLTANVILIPQYGATGAAIATLLSVSILCIAQFWCCRLDIADKTDTFKLP